MITQDYLRGRLSYDPATGIFTRAVDTHKGRWKAGTVTGTIRPDGYVIISIDGITYFAHHLAWLYVYGEWLPNRIDHRNRERSQNWIENLRRCTPTLNQGNTKHAANNTSGFRGVVWHKKSQCWQAQIGRGGKAAYIGSFSDRETAARAYDRAAVARFGEFATLNFP